MRESTGLPPARESVPGVMGTRTNFTDNATNPELRKAWEFVGLGARISGMAGQGHIFGWLHSLFSDCRFALRQFRKSPGFTSVAIITLALGIGANTAIFSVIEAVLVRPLPYKEPSRLVIVADHEDPAGGGVLYKDFEAWKSQIRSFEDMAAYYRDSGICRVTLTASGEPESVHGAFVSSEFFPTLGVQPQLGRFFNSDEEVHRDHVVILSHGLWLRRLGASGHVLGKKLQIDGSDWEIIGVMPPPLRSLTKTSSFGHRSRRTGPGKKRR